MFGIGFRPFFLSAALYSIMVTGLWVGIYVFAWNIHPGIVPPITWHAHEMVFGYGMAVVAGFLLTAVRNWTGYSTLRGLPLAALLGSWLLARICFFIEGVPVWLTALIDNGFLIGLLWAIFFPILKARNWQNMGVVAKIGLIFISNAVFYLGLLHILPSASIRIGLYSAFYLLVAMVALIGRRIFPFFVEHGVEGAKPLITRKWIDHLSLWGFLLFWVGELGFPNSVPVGVVASVLALVYLIRMVDWYTSKIWRRPLLWVLYVAYAYIILGFILKAAAVFLGVSPFLSVHAFAYGVIGISTIGMMARVSLGHTGRNIHQAPNALHGIFLLLSVGAIIRTLFPVFFPTHYLVWISVSEVLWVLSFSGFLVIYTPMFFAPRVDGRADQ